MDEKFQEILEQASQVYMRYGIKSVTMDDMARHLGISKKTLYKYVSDKGDLVNKAMVLINENEVAVMCEITERGLNAIDELFEIAKHVVTRLTNIHPSIHYDLEKYYPEAWTLFNKHKRSNIYNCVLDNMLKGKTEGVYRENLNAEIISLFYISKLDVVFNAEIFPPDKFKFVDVYLEVIRYHVRGIASDKGIIHLKEKLKKEKDLGNE